MRIINGIEHTILTILISRETRRKLRLISFRMDRKFSEVAREAIEQYVAANHVEPVPAGPEQ